MKVKMFAIHDSKAEAFLQPFFLRSVGEALRAFESTINDAQTNFYRYPADYTLFELGEYDDSTATMEMCNPKRALGNAVEFHKPTLSTPVPMTSEGAVKEIRSALKAGT